MQCHGCHGSLESYFLDLFGVWDVGVYECMVGTFRYNGKHGANRSSMPKSSKHQCTSQPPPNQSNHQSQTTTNQSNISQLSNLPKSTTMNQPFNQSRLFDQGSHQGTTRGVTVPRRAPVAISCSSWTASAARRQRCRWIRRRGSVSCGRFGQRCGRETGGRFRS